MNRPDSRAKRASIAANLSPRGADTPYVELGSDWAAFDVYAGSIGKHATRGALNPQ